MHSVKKRVLHILNSSLFSGAENVACQIIRFFQDDPNYEMAYCSPEGSIQGALSERGIPFIPVQKVTVSELKRVITLYQPDIIHAHDMRTGFFSALVCGKIPLISHIHNNNFENRAITVKSVLFRFAAMKARHIFWVSEAAMQGYVFHKQIENKSSVLQNVLDMEQLKRQAETAPLQGDYDIVFLGRLSYEKNPQRLLNVVRAVAEKKPDIRAALIGSGELEAEVLQLIDSLQLTANVDCLGFQKNPYGILNHAKLMLMTSRWEGLPMCALEAMALGVPIVSTPTDGLKELIRNGENGYLCDSDEQLTESILYLINHEEERTAMSDHQKLLAEKLNDKKAYVSALLDAYKKV